MWKEKWFSIWWTVFVWPSVHNSLASCLLPWQVGQSNVSNTAYNISIWYLIMRKRKKLHFPCNTTLILIICLYFQHYDNVLIRQNLFTHTICLSSFSSYCRYIQCYKLRMKMIVSVDWTDFAGDCEQWRQCAQPSVQVHCSVSINCNDSIGQMCHSNQN